MPLSLDGPWEKVDRAIEELNALNLGCHVFLKTKPYYITTEFEPDAGHHVVRLRVRQDVPLALSVIVGNIVHNLRSALDQAVWVIACRSHPTKKLWQDNIATQIAFPFFWDCKKFPGKVGPYIADDAKAVLHRAQPYQRTNRTDALYAIDRLWNIDKHRVVHGGFAAIDLSGVTFRQAALFMEQFAEARIEIVWGRDRIAKDGTPIANAYFSDPPEGIDPALAAQAAHVDVDGEPSAQIFFGARGGERGYGIAGFARLIDYVAETLTEIQVLPATPPAT